MTVNTNMNAPEFDRIAREIFGPVYISIAGQIKAKTCITKGACLDLGTGGGYLGIALARITDLDFYLLDSSREMVEIARCNIIDAGLTGRLHAIHGDVHDIPLAESSVELVISRGSIFFWKDKVKAFREIYRVLVPGGVAYIGGGLGAREVRQQVREKMKQAGRTLPGMNNKKNDHQAEYREALQKACIVDSSVTRSEVGLWIEIWKQNS